MENATTKERLIVDIILHHLKPENRQANPLTTKDGKVVTEMRDPDTPIFDDARPTKFIIYCEFISMLYMLKSVSLYDII